MVFACFSRQNQQHKARRLRNPQTSPGAVSRGQKSNDPCHAAVEHTSVLAARGLCRVCPAAFGSRLRSRRDRTGADPPDRERIQPHPKRVLIPPLTPWVESHPEARARLRTRIPSSCRVSPGLEADESLPPAETVILPECRRCRLTHGSPPALIPRPDAVRPCSSTSVIPRTGHARASAVTAQAVSN